MQGSPVKGLAGEISQLLDLAGVAAANLRYLADSGSLRTGGHLLASLSVGLNNLLAKLLDLGVLALCLRQLPDALDLQADHREFMNEMLVAGINRQIGAAQSAGGPDQARRDETTQNFSFHK